ncbi:hypothetical protein ACNOYE_39695 [Nannocystaceae bacterium ST9]
MRALALVSILLGDPPTPAPEPAASVPEPAPPAPAPDPDLLARALAELPTSPSLAEVQQAALDQAGIDPRQARATLRRARAAAAAPRMSVQFDHRLDQGWVLDQEAGTADALRNDAGNQSVLRIDATWDLDRLVFSPDELRVTRSALDLADWRQRVLFEVTQLYFERQRLLLEERLAPAADLETAIDRAIRLREVEGSLAGLTGLEFAPPRSR